MILSYANKSKGQEDFNDDSLKIDTINEIEELLSKRSKKINYLFIDIDNILDTNAEKIFLQNVSGYKKSDNSSSKSSKSKNRKNRRKKSKLSDFLKSGFLDYSLDSNSDFSKEDQVDKNDEKTKKKRKKNKNFVLKSELFSSFENDKKMKSQKASPKPSML